MIADEIKGEIRACSDAVAALARSRDDSTSTSQRRERLLDRIAVLRSDLATAEASPVRSRHTFTATVDAEHSSEGVMSLRLDCGIGVLITGRLVAIEVNGTNMVLSPGHDGAEFALLEKLRGMAAEACGVS